MSIESNQKYGSSENAKILEVKYSLELTRLLIRITELNPL